MADRNRSDLDREQRGTSNPNQTERPESRSTREGDTESDNMATNDEDSRGAGNRSTGNIEGDENLNRR